MVTFNGVVSAQVGPEVVTVNVTDAQGNVTTVTTTTGSDGSFSVTENLAPGEYTAQASIPADAQYTSAQSDVESFVVGLTARTITLTVTQ